MAMFELHHGDALAVLRGMADNSIDAIVTDPPAGIAFMGKDWDKDKGGRGAWIDWMSQIAAECLRVLKPGAHALVWAIPRTSHWTATAWEDAGFEVRDRIAHVFGSGFPKSLNLKDAMPGWGTALKPAVEDWWLLRKPISESSIAANVLRWGTGGVNVDSSRINPGEVISGGGGLRGGAASRHQGWQRASHQNGTATKSHSSGRFPANLIHDGSAEVMGMFPVTTSGAFQQGTIQQPTNGVAKNKENLRVRDARQGDTGSAARFFKACPPDDAASVVYCAKASRSERDAGLDGMEARPIRESGSEFGKMSMWKGSNGDDKWKAKNPNNPARNHHPTVKPQSLMRYLCRLITPPSGIILDPFFGSGSTGVAAITEGFSIIGIEQDAEFAEIARRRCEHAKTEATTEVELPPLLAVCEVAA